MSKHEYEEGCNGCRPVLVSQKSGKPLPEDAPEMMAISAVWDTATEEEKRAFHSVTCNNSRSTEDYARANPLITRMTTAIEKLSIN